MPQTVQDENPKFDEILGKDWRCPTQNRTFRVIESDRASFTKHWNGTQDDGETVYGIPCPCGGFVYRAPNGRLIHLY